MRIPAPSRLLLGVVCAASLIGTSTAAAASTYEATATGTIQYLRKDKWPAYDGDVTSEQQVALKFTTHVADLQFDVNHNLKSAGAVTTTVSEVRGAYHAVAIGPQVYRTGSCSADSATVVSPGAMEEDLLTPLDGSRFLNLRPFGELDVPMGACSGEMGFAHTMMLMPWGEAVGESAIDLTTQMPDEAFRSDVWTGPLEAAAPAAKCPLLSDFATLCSMAIEGQITVSKTGGDPTPVPGEQPKGPAPKPTPAPDGPEMPAKPVNGGDGKVTGRLRWGNGGRSVKVRLSCSERCVGKLSLSLPGSGKGIGKPVLIDLKPGASRTVVVPVTRAQRRAIERARKVGVRFTAAQGSTATPSAKQTLKAPAVRAR